ncbi:MAG TPA: YbhB/YbcL family Raf kinase inhibitor-like protein [Campylobacterales bacterium]|nr:YbhB/YbcL family Raf kinase inhibitor-like protein [Campylobacterales bacterium]HHS92497.1 YbhB/YbcL family Raf kinase inhibitor-like protein [Campylobacterales bacterium]
MKPILLTLLVLSGLMADNFTLTSKDLKGQLTKTQEFNSFGCSGENKSPELTWSNAPKGTKSFALTVYDPDAPTGSGWWHWLIVNIPSSSTSITTDASNSKKLPKGALETVNDYGKTNFGGACPPEGDKAHTYIFTVHALDVEKLDLTAKSDSALVGYMINKHTIQKATLVSYYER